MGNGDNLNIIIQTFFDGRDAEHTRCTRHYNFFQFRTSLNIIEFVNLAGQIHPLDNF